MLVASRDALREALAPLPEFAPCRARAVVAFIARIEQLLGRQDAARGLLEQALAAQPDLGSTEATALRLELAAERSSSPTGRACTAMQTRRLGPPGRGPIPR